MAHQGGQARPLYTPRTWEPNPASSGDEVEVIEYPEPRRSLSELGTVSLVPQSALYQPVRAVGLAPKPSGSSDPYGKGGKAVSSSSASVEARPKAVSKASSSVVETGTSSSSSRGPRVITVEDESETAAASASTAVDPYRFSGPQWHKAFPYPGLPAVTEPFGFHPWDLTPAKLHPSVKAYLWSADQSSLIKVEQDIAKLTGSAVVLDWHHVLDTDRQSSRNVQWVGPDGQIPWRHRATLLELSHLCREFARPVHLVICSHIETSSKNLENVIHATEQSGLPVQLVLITTKRTGPQGKLAALRSAISGDFCLFDDNTEIIEEFVEASRPIAQFLKPRARRSTLLPDNCIGWSISSDPLYSTAKRFVKYFSRSSA